MYTKCIYKHTSNINRFSFNLKTINHLWCCNNYYNSSKYFHQVKEPYIMPNYFTDLQHSFVLNTMPLQDISDI